MARYGVQQADFCGEMLYVLRDLAAKQEARILPIGGQQLHRVPNGRWGGSI